MSSWRKSVAGFLLVTLSSPSFAVVTIEHQAIDCIVRNTHARVEARYAPETVVQKRVYFRASGTDDFYWVELAGDPGGTLAAFLPKPHPTTESIEYYLQGEVSSTDRAQTDHFSPVVSTMTYCQNEAKNFRQPADNEQVSIVLGLIRWGQAAVPEGFLPTNIASVVLADGTTASISEAMKAGGTQQSASGQSASASSGAGGGMSTWAIVGGALGAAGLAVAVGGGGGGGDDSGGNGGPPPGPTLPASCAGVTEANFYDKCGNVTPSTSSSIIYYTRIRSNSCECFTIDTSSPDPSNWVRSAVSSCNFDFSSARLAFSGCGFNQSGAVTSCGSTQAPGGSFNLFTAFASSFWVGVAAEACPGIWN